VDKTAEAGINRIRFEVRAGSENTIDSYANFRDAGFPYDGGAANMAWRAARYETVNDNNDPNVINPAGFHWTEIDSVADNLVNPLRAKLAARGESLYINLNYVVALSQVTSGKPYVHASTAEYAEFMLAAFQHLQARNGWVPNGIEVSLEPDAQQPVWTGTYIGQVIVATAARLAAAGFTPDFIGPSTMCMDSAGTFFDQAMAVPGAAAKIKELSYHRSCGLTSGALQTLATKAQARGIGTSMLEWWDSGLNYHTLHETLKNGRATAWQQATFVDLWTRDGIGVSYINPAMPTVAEFTNPTKFLSLYYQNVRFGAVRVDATSNNSTFDPLAFRNKNGTFAVVVKAGSGGTFTVTGLPAGVYGIKYASQFTNATGTRPDQTIVAGQAVNVDVPTSGVITVYGKTSGPIEICGDGIDNDGDGQIDEDCAPPPPPPVEICGDRIDNDGDGLIDEDCTEICGDGIDNDGDGLIDEDCTTTHAVPGAPRRLSGSVRRSTVSIKWYAPLTGGAVVDYLVEAGVVPGQTLYSTPVGAMRSVSVPGVGTGRYYVRVRARNQNGVSAASNEIVLSVGCGGPPRKSTGLTATSVEGVVTFSWIDPDGCSGASYTVTVGRAALAGDVQTLASPDNTVTTLLQEGTYFARVTTMADTGSSVSNDLQFKVEGSACATPRFHTTLQSSLRGRHVGFSWSPLDPETALDDDDAATVSYVIEVGSAPGSSNFGVVPMGRDTAIATDAP
ncbi:MAG TPA: MopE-related protein, partial [Vicinamibacterales bacterium]|nr:MopE-related protein [Vicinamibacterales bacterium]